jgi:hypothetical protein
LFAVCSQEIFIVRVISQSNGFSNVVRDLIRLSPTTKVDGSEAVTSRDLARHEEIVLPILARALSNVIAKLSLSVDGDLCSLIEPEAIDIQH